MTIIRKKLDNLKPGKQYILTVRTKNNDINTVANLAESIRFTVPQDGTIPDTITNLQLYASFEKVMFVFNYSAEPDISRYEYELYSDPTIEVATPPLVSSGFNAANVFTVSVPNSYTEDSGGNFNTIAKSYWGRIRGIDTTGNAGPWTSLVKTDDDTPLIDSQYIDNLTASKITAGTIGAHTIQLNGANSILKSSNYDAGAAGWIIKGDGSAEFRNVSIGGSSTIDGLDANALEDAIANFNNRNDRISTVPATPDMVASPSSIEHTISTGGSANVSFKWTYNGTGDAYNIDGFFLYVKSATTSGGVATALENVYAITSEKRAAILYGVPSDHFYSFSIQAYRIVDTDINANGILKSSTAFSSQNPYRPTANVQFSGDITGTIGGVSVNTVVANANAGATVAQNFNANNDRNGTTPTTPVVATNGTAVDYTENQDGSANISFEWDYTTSPTPTAVNNIDGFIVYVRQSATSEMYTFGGANTATEETVYYVSSDKRAMVFPGVPSNNYYTFGVRAYRLVDTDIDSSGMKMSALVKATGTSPEGRTENPFRPVDNVRFSGDVTGTIDGVSASTVVSGASSGAAVSNNFNANNDRNGTTPTAPTILNDGTAVDHTLNTDGSSSISLEWNYTSSATPSAASNIDGFIVTMRASTSSSVYTFGSSPAEETIYYVSPDKRAIIFSGVPTDLYYTFGVRAYRIVDSDIDSSGIKLSTITKAQGSGENPYRPAATVAFAGDVTGTIGSTPASTLVSQAQSGASAAANFNTNNDQNATIPTVPTVPTDGTAIDHVQNTDGSVDISFEWTYTNSSVWNQANNIDGFIISVYSSVPGVSTSYTMGSTPALETNFYAPADNRAFFLQGVPANRYYTFGVRAYRIVDSNINSSGVLVSSYVQSSRSEENPYLPSATVAFSGSLVGTLGPIPVTSVISNANLGATAAQNFNANNDRNATTPTAPVLLIDGTAVDYTSNTDGSVNISFEWTYTTSDVATATNNIDGFVVYMRQSPTSEQYTFGSTNAALEETVYYVSSDKRAMVFPGVPADQYYTFGVRAYRYVDTDISSPGIKLSTLVKAQGAGADGRTENPFRPLDNVAFGGNVVGTINGVSAVTVVSNASAGFSAATNFNANNDRNSSTPTAPTVLTNGDAVDHTLNTDGSCNISFEWNYTTSTVATDANNIDGFIVYVYSSASSASYNFGTATALETIYYTTADKRSIIFSGLPANLYYTFGIRAYRLVDTDIDSTGMKLSSITKATALSNVGDATPRSESPYLPSANIAFAGDITGTVGGVAASTVVANASLGAVVSANFNANNDRNATTPTSPGVLTDGTAVDHTLNADGSANISFEWSYTVSSVATATNNIDGFIVYVRASSSSSAYNFGDSTEESTYFLPATQRAIVFSGVPANQYYTFGVRAYRSVDSDVDTSGMKTSVIVKATLAEENPYRPSATVAFSGNLSGTINNVPISDIISNANSGATAAQNFNTNNDRNATSPTSPTIPSDGTSVDHTINTDGSSNISFEWNYTTSSTPSAANNIDGFIVSVYQSTTSGTYTFGGSPANEATYYIPADKRAMVLSGVPANRYYTFGVRAYRYVDTDISPSGVLTSAIIKPAGMAPSEDPYLPSSTVAFAGDITGTVSGVQVASLVTNANLGATVAQNFNTNNDRNGTTPTSPTVASDGTAVDHTLNTDGSADISFEWSYTLSENPAAANNIDGFIVYVRPGSTNSAYTFGSNISEESTYYLTADRRAMVLSGVPANLHYTFGVRAYRLVDTDIDPSGMKLTPIIYALGTGENPFQPSSTVAFSGSIVGTLGPVPVANVIANANSGATAAQNFNANNDRNATTPTDPTIPSNGTSVDHAINTDGSANISFEWNYTTSAVPSAANNIDGFIAYVRQSTSSGPYSFGTTLHEETTYFIPGDKRAMVLYGVPANQYYTFGVRAYRYVDTDIAASGLLTSSLVKPAGTSPSEDPYLPSSTVAFAGDITGTVASTAATTVVNNALQGSRVAQNFYANNDQNALTPPTPTIANAAAALEYVRNTDGSVDISLDWSYTSSLIPSDAANIDGFIVSVVIANTNTAYTMGINPAIEVNYYTSAESRTFVLSGVASDKYYTFGLRAYRIVDNEIRDASTGALTATTGGIVTSAYATPSYTGANPYQPSASVPFAGDITGTIGNVAASTVVSNAQAGYLVAQNFNVNNDRNALVPDAPGIANDGTAIDHTRNTDSSVDLSFEWTYTPVDAWDHKNNIDGFIVTSYSSDNSVSYMQSLDAIGNLASIPHNTNLNIGTEIELVVRCAPDSWSADRPIIGKWVSGQYGYTLYHAGLFNGNGLGYLTLFLCDGPNIIGAHSRSQNNAGDFVSVPFVNGSRGWVRVTYRKSDGLTQFFYALDQPTVPTSWTQLGVNQTHPVLAPTNSTQRLVIGHNDDGAAYSGKIYRAIVRTVIGGPAVADIDFTRISSTAQTTMAALTGQTVTFSKSGANPLLTIPGSYTVTGSGALETNYYVPRDNRAFVLPGVASDRFYTFGIRAYRLVDTNVTGTGLITSTIAQSAYTGTGSEHPYKPEVTVAYAGNILGTIGGIPASVVVDNASQGSLVAQNYFANNDQNVTQPTAPGLPLTSGTAIDHVENDNATVDISFEWTYTTSTTPSAANNIDGFITSVYSSNPNVSGPYIMGSTPNFESNYYVPADRRSFILQGVASNRYYTFGVRAYRVVDSVVDGTPTDGIVVSNYTQSLEAGEHPYRPSENVSYRGSITGTIGGSPVSLPVVDIIGGINNFNTRNDRNGIKPATPTGLLFNFAQNLDSTVDLSIDWNYTGTGNSYDVDGFVLYIDRSPGTQIDYISHSGGVNTYTALAPHGLTTGNIVNITEALPSGYNATGASVTVLNSTQFTITSASNPGTHTYGGIVAKVVNITSPPAESVQQVVLTAERRGYTFPNMSAEDSYRVAIRAFRVVDTDIYNAYTNYKAGNAIYGDLLTSSMINSRTPKLGGSSGINLGNGRIYIGEGLFQGANTGFYVDYNGNFSLKDKLSWNNSTSVLNVTGIINAISGNFTGGITVGTGGSISSGQVGFNNGTGFWIGSDAGTPKFSIGNSSGNRLTWNGTALTMTGEINATSGTFSGSISSTATITGGTFKTLSDSNVNDFITLNKATLTINSATYSALTGGTIGASAARISFVNPIGAAGLLESNSGFIFSAKTGTPQRMQLSADSTSMRLGLFNHHGTEFFWLDTFNYSNSANSLYQSYSAAVIGAKIQLSFPSGLTSSEQALQIIATSQGAGIPRAAGMSLSAGSASGTMRVYESFGSIIEFLQADNLDYLPIRAKTVDARTSFLGTANRTSGYATTTGYGAAMRCDTISDGSLHYFHTNWLGGSGGATALEFFIDSSKIKTFVINHPDKEDSYLVHACSEGPTSDVFYRGEDRLENGECIVTLPSYFESLTEIEGRTIIITPISSGRGGVANLAASRVENGQFKVVQTGGYVNDDQEFFWRVDAIRKSTAFEVEPLKSEVQIAGDGPYTYISS